MQQLSAEDYLDKIICQGNLRVLFQPIVSHRQQFILGYEALIRGPSDTPLYSPVDLFATAVSVGRLVELELLCRKLSIHRFKQLNLPGKLFLNTSPESLFQPGFRSDCNRKMLQKVGIEPENVVIELTEQYPLENYEGIREAIQHYRQMGVEIAIDDLGSGYAGLRMWSELRPDYVKIDRHFIQGIDQDGVKQEFVRSIKDIAQGLNCTVIGEGIETAGEFRTLAGLGIELCQGYYFARPTDNPPLTLVRELFSSQPDVPLSHSGQNLFSKTIGELQQQVTAIASSATLEETAQIFQVLPQFESLPVVSEGRPVGMVRRNTLMGKLLSRFGRELHGKKPVMQFVDGNSLMMESHLPVEEASHIISEQMRKSKALDFIITEEGQYCGIGSVIDLLKVITELQVRSARYANPLTMLPGNVPIYETLDQLLYRRQEFVFCYCDLDNFKPFNDKYGYERGDQVIKDLADILRARVKDKQDFIGHIGGDDFVLIFQSGGWRQCCEAILSDFKHRASRYYHREDIHAGGIWSQDRAGSERFFPMLSLSIGCVSPDPVACKSHHDVAALASGAKHEAKRVQGNSLFVDSRRQPQGQRLHEAVA